MEYQQVHRQEGVYADRRYGIKVLLALDRPLSEADAWAVQTAADVMLKAIHRETFLHDPEKIAEHAKIRAELLGCFPAGAPVHVEEIPNQYSDDAYNVHNPWLVVTTCVGRIKIGWRKHVISIDWADSAVKTRAAALFPDEPSTLVDWTIHAWSLADAGKYLAAIIAAGPKT